MSNMTLADLKRMEPGTKLVLVHSLLGPTHQPCTLHSKNTTCLMFKKEGKNNLSYLWFPKASEFQSDANGFTIFEDGEVAAQYIFG